LTSGGVGLSAGMLIGQSRELLATLATSDVASKSKIVSAPAIIATDSIPASISVGVDVPTLTSQSVGGVIVSGSSQFTNTVSSRSTGVSLNITARVNPSGVVTLMINQELSAPVNPSSNGIQSPSFSKRAVQTQITMQDGDTIAIGGIIAETSGWTTQGMPGISRIPILGSLFGSQSYNKGRSEIIIFMTPRVIYDTNELAEASDELKLKLRQLRRLVQE
jgi:general secretion pathway protein D